MDYNSEELEKAILGCILIDPSLAEKTALMKQAVFGFSKHQFIFASMKLLYEEGKEVDMLSLSDKLKEVKQFDTCGGGSYLVELTMSDCSPSMIMQYYNSLVEKFQVKAVHGILSGLEDKGPDFLTNEITRRIDVIRSYSVVGEIEVSDPILDQDFVPFTWGTESSDKYISPIIKTSYIIYTGEEGCLTGDTEVKVNRGGNCRTYTLKYLYNMLNGNPDSMDVFKYSKGKLRDDIVSKTRSFDGNSIGLKEFSTVQYSGKKEVAELILKNGKKIKATFDHKIMTKRGWVEMGELTSYDMVMCDTELPVRSGKKRKKVNYLTRNNVPFHPFAQKARDPRGKKSSKIETHRLIVEASMNNVSLDEFIEILRNDQSKAETMEFINPKQYAVHHINEDKKDNRRENLDVMTHSEHKLHHANYENFGQGVPRFSGVAYKRIVGFEDTYDIVDVQPHHNFVANGIVVHNSGKSTYIMDMARKNAQRGKKIDYLTLEQSPEALIRQIALNRAAISKEQFAKQTITNRQRQIYQGTIDELNKESGLNIIGMDGATPTPANIIRRYQQSGADLLIIDNFGKITLDGKKYSQENAEAQASSDLLECTKGGMPIILIHHMRKGDTKTRKAADIRGSGKLKDDATCVIYGARGDYGEGAQPIDKSLYILKEWKSRLG